MIQFFDTELCPLTPTFLPKIQNCQMIFLQIIYPHIIVQKYLHNLGIMIAHILCVVKKAFLAFIFNLANQKDDHHVIRKANY